ncbi:MAG: S8 family serine peptidase [Candidatus Sumerlaeaceae bacterium]
MPRLWRVIVVMFAWLAGLWSQAAGPPPASQVMPEFGASKEEVRQRLAKKAATRGLDRVDGETKLEDRGEFYRSGHTTIPLWRLPSQFAVKYREGVDPAVANKQIRDAAAAAVQELASCKPKRLGIFSTSAEDTTAVIGQVKRSSVVEKVFPVYVYPVDHARMVATDDIILCVETEGARNALMPTLASMGIALVSQLPQKHINVYLVRLTAQAKDDALGACEKLNQLPGVKWAEPDFVRELFFDFSPNDPLFSKQQGLHNTGANGAVADADVDAPEGWDITVGSPSVVIAIIDDGVDTSHTDLLIAPGGYDFYNNDSDPSPTGTDGHGTGCAGVAAAIVNNGYHTAGIAGGCKILPVKISQGSSFASNTVIGNAISYAADHADVLSNSWGGGASSSYINSAIDYAVTYGRGGKGCPVFFASGNSASGWYQGGGRYRLSTTGLNGNYYIAFDYTKDVSLAFGLDTVYVDNVCLLNADTYSHIWREDFEGPIFPPTGWTLASSTGSNFWFRTTTNAYTATAGSYSARAGAIGNNQWTDLRTPLLNLTGSETLCFAAYVSTQANKDLFYVDIYTQTGTYVGSWGPFSGVPTITTSVAYPANYVNTIAVGASSDCDRRSDYSEYGPELDFVAPSNGGWNDIVTLDPTGSVGWTSDDYKTNFGGTSSACPLAAGIAALRLSYNPSETAASLRSWMHAHCDKIGGLPYSGGEPGAGGRNDQYGYGRVTHS